MLTKRQLIEKLIALPVPDDTPVVTEGFDETNYTSISDPYLIQLKLNVTSPFPGEHVGEGDRKWNDYPEIPTTTCIVVSFTEDDDD